MSANHSFLRLEDLLLPPPFPAIVSLLIVLGTLNLSKWGARWLKTENKTALESAAVFVLTTGLLAALLHAAAWAGYASPSMLRWVGWPLAALGVLELSKWKPGKAVIFFGDYWREGSRLERCTLIISGLALIALFVAALGPATDADSLEYHLGVPLDWLRHGGAYARPDWFHARLVGLGESINMLGLAMGTDSLGAAFQAAGLVVAITGVTAFAKTSRDRLLGVLLVAACPVIIALTTAQKWMLLPAAGLTVALIILVQRQRLFDRTTAFLACGCASFAAASKYSFLLSASVVVVIGLIVAFQAGQFRSAFVTLIFCFLFIAAPVFARNVMFYADPLPPLLESWKTGGDPALIAFAQYLRDYGGALSLQRLLSLPWDLAVSFRPALFHDVLGIGVFGFLLVLRKGDSHRILPFAALAVFFLIVAFSQLRPRFFLEPYLWCATAAVAAPWSSLKSFFFRVLTAQAILVAFVAVYLGAVSFGGEVTRLGRERVMNLMAAGYSESRWLDSVLPPNAVVLEDFRYRALMPRPFVVGDRYLNSDGVNWRESLTDFIREKKVTVLVTHYPIEQSPYGWVASRYGTPLAGPARFQSAARSPFNRGALSEWIAIQINVNGPPS